MNEHDGSRFYPHLHRNQQTLDELDEVLRNATAADINQKDVVSIIDICSFLCNTICDPSNPFLFSGEKRHY